MGIPIFGRRKVPKKKKEKNRAIAISKCEKKPDKQKPGMNELTNSSKHIFVDY